LCFNHSLILARLIGEIYKDLSGVRRTRAALCVCAYSHYVNIKSRFWEDYFPFSDISCMIYAKKRSSIFSSIFSALLIYSRTEFREMTHRCAACLLTDLSYLRDSLAASIFQCLATRAIVLTREGDINRGGYFALNFIFRSKCPVILFPFF